MKTTLLLALAGTAACAAAWAGPAVALVEDSSAIVYWESDDTLAGIVEYGLSEAYGQSAADTGATTRHELVLAGLAPDTAWHYRAISGADTTPDHTFRARASAGRPFRFAVYGDNQDDSTMHQRVVDQMMSCAPDAQLALNVGDLVQNGTVAEWRSWFNIERAIVAGRPVLPAPGNHDIIIPDNWSRFLVLPGSERWHSAHWGSVALHCLDAYSDFSPSSAQYDWLLSELLADSADPAVRFILVNLHLPPYTTNRSYAGNVDARQWLCPLFERFGVAVVFAGHVHAYEHSLVNGVHYINPGSGGAALSTGWNAAQPYTVYREAAYSFVVAEASGDSLVLSGVRVDGTGFDTTRLGAPPVALAEPGPAPRVALSARGQGRVELELAAGGPVRVAAFDACGRLGATLASGRLAAGRYEYGLSTRLARGCYIVRAEAGRYSASAKVCVY
ncbi:MAG: metallophosphoesterase [bacterium]